MRLRLTPWLIVAMSFAAWFLALMTYGPGMER